MVPNYHITLVAILLAAFFISSSFSRQTQSQYNTENHCNQPRVRKAWQSLSDEEQQLFYDAMLTAYKTGLYKDFCEIHFQNFAPSHNAAPFFLPWHRYFIYVFETEIRKLHPRFACFTLPYWTWESTSSIGTAYLFNSNSFGSRVNGCVQDGKWYNWWNETDNVDPTPPCILRTWPSKISVCGEACTMDLITRNKIWNTFAVEFEDIAHKSAHKIVGGIVDGAKSTYDPIFWLLHSNIDRQWAIWQDCHDHDRVSARLLGPEQYVGRLIGDVFQDMDTCMPFNHNGKPTRYFQQCVTTRMVQHIQRNPFTRIDFDFYYDDANFMIPLISRNYGKCNFDWDWNWDKDLYKTTVSSANQKRFLKRSAEHLGDHESKPKYLTEKVGSKNHVTLKKGTHAVELYWTKTGDMISFEVETMVPSEAWLGIGWGGEDKMMTNADMVISSKAGDVWKVQDYFSTEYAKPELDESQDISDMSAGYSNGKSWMKFSRKLKTEDSEKDRDIEGNLNIAFAIGFSGILKDEAHKFAGHQLVALYKDENSHKHGDDGNEIPDPVFLRHDYFNREFGYCLPKEQIAYNHEKTPGLFGNFLMENAKERIDSFYNHNPDLPEAHDEEYRIRMYHVAECEVESVKFYSNSFVFEPPCWKENVPVRLSKEHSECRPL